MSLPYIAAVGNAALNQTNLIPQIYSKKMQHRFYARTALMEIANTDYQGEIKGAGDTVIIRSAPTVTINDYEGQVNYQTLTSGVQQLNIDKAKYYAFIEDAVTTAQADIPYINGASDDASKNMIIKVEQDVFAGIQPDFLPSHTLTLAVTKENIVDLLLHAGRIMDEFHVDGEHRKMLLPPWACEMLKGSELRDASKTGDTASVIRNGGKIGMIDRWDIISNTNLPFNGTTGETSAMGMTKHFLTFASQFEQHQTVQLESTFGVGHRGMKLYGYKGGIVPEAGVMLKIKPA